MKGKNTIDWKTVVTVSATVVTAVAALIAAILGQDGISGWNDKATQNSPQEETKVKFSCQKLDGFLSTVALNPRRKAAITTAIIKWDLGNEYFGDNWPPSRRCEEVSKRFQDIYDRDQLAFITADIASWGEGINVPVICSVQAKGSRCIEEDLLFTLQKQDDPNKVLSDLIALRESPDTNKSLIRGDADSFSEGVRIYYDLSKIIETPQSDSTPKEEAAF